MADAVISESQAVPMTSEEIKNIPDAVQTSDIQTVDTHTLPVQDPVVQISDVRTSDVQASDTITSNVPTSDVPISDVPTSDVPTSDVPISDVPTSDVPTSDVPTSDVPISDVPTSDVPTTDVPTADVPTSDVPTSDVPTLDVPTSDVPTADVPTSNVPTTDVPTTDVQTVDTQILDVKSDVQTADTTLDSNQEMKNRIVKLEAELRMRTEERENFKNRLHQAENKLSQFTKKEGQASNTANDQVKIEMERDENQQLREVIANMKIVVKEKTTSYACQELQMKALETQVAALKEVATLTKGMLTIRNRENEKLKEQIDLTAKKIESERVRNNAVLKKTELASSLNAQLREEYLNQVKLFGDLKGKYEKKINILTEEVARLNRQREEEREETVDQ